MADVSMAAFKKCERRFQTPHGWRLATVKDAKDNLDSIKHNNLLQKWDRARLLDGWIGGSGYDFHVQVGFRSCLGYMLLVESSIPDISVSEDERYAGLYSKVHLNEAGRNAALLLCCEDWNYEVVYWLITGEKEEGSASGVGAPINLGDEIELASELVSALARQLQRVHEESRVPKTEFSRASMKALMSRIKGLMSQIQDKDKVLYNNLNDILFLTEFLDLGDECWNEMRLTEDLEQFNQSFGFDTTDASTWEAIADTVWYVAAEAMAVAIVRESCRILTEKVDHRQLEGQRMEDRAFVSSVVAYANELLDGIFFGYDSLWKIVEKAAKRAKGDSKKFNMFMLREQAYGTFSYDGCNYSVFNTILVQAAKKGHVNLVERLIECGVQPSETDDKRKKTALHHAAKLDDEVKGIVIAKMLLREKTKTFANAVDGKLRTPLHRAAFCRHVGMCELLLNHGSSVSSKDENGQIPLHYALSRELQNEEAIRVLISAEAEVSVETKCGSSGAEDDNGKTLLNSAGMISAETEDSVEVKCGRSSPSVDAEDINGKTPLDLAVEFQGSNVKMVTWLLSLSNKPEKYFNKLELSSYLRESSRMGYMHLVKKLLKKRPNLLDTDDEGKTALHYAAEGKTDNVARRIISELLSADQNGQVKNVELATACDKYGRSVLHVAAFLGHKTLCDWLLNLEGVDVDTPDRDGQSALYYAVAGDHDDDEVLDKFIFRVPGMHQVYLKDLSQTTPLHLAAERGNLKMVEKLLSKRVISKQERNKYVRAADVLGQTALHKAASGGHKKIVRKLLDEGAHPLDERDCDGKTALHYAVQAENGEDAMSIVKLLLKNCESNKQKILLLFASAVGIGSAEQSLSSNSLLKTYLAEEKSKILNTTKTENLLRVAATSGNIDMTREFLTRGANISAIRNHKWRNNLEEEEDENVRNVLEQIDNIVEQRTDKPALWDNLGRSAFANGLAALFLNPFVKSPITVGISGEWGMGKSSLMAQTESILIKTAAQLAFSTSLQIEDFPGTSKSRLSAIGKDRREKIAQSIKMLSTTKESKAILKRSKAKKWNAEYDPKNKPKLNSIHKFGMFIKCLFRTSKNYFKNHIAKEGLKALHLLPSVKNHTANVGDTDTLAEFLGNYQPKYHEVFKSLAVMDRSDMFEYDEDEEEYRSVNQSDGELSGMPWEEEDSMQGTTPSILTVRYNAWQYRNESEAWAGLAVEITKELEATMTVAQKLRSSWRYNWKTSRNTICFGVIIPCFLAVFMAIWLTTIVWLLLHRANSKYTTDFKYGSLPATVIVALWAVVKSVMSVVKPISSQIVDYICLPDHSGKLGYHRKVIFDVNFLKEELGERPSWLWKMFAFIWCCITFSWDENYVPNTKQKIPKMPPASKDNLRMVVFVDDLDRCQENVILQILSAVNLVLAACEINVILGMDKSMIERAIIRMFGDKNSKPNQSSQDLADKYLRKIIQLPLDLPDPSNSESESFLQAQLGMLDARKGTTDSEAETEMHSAYAHRKVNPKFQMGTSIPRKGKPARGEPMKYVVETGARDLSFPARGEPMKYLTETGAIKDRDLSFSGTDAAREGSIKKEQTETNGETGFLNEETKILIADTADTEQLNKREEPDTGDNDKKRGVKKCRSYTKRENTENEQRQMEMSPITSEMLFPKYSEGEKNAFCFLQTHSTRSRRLPREWKRLLYYHRLAWNILSKSPEVRPVAGWQVQLIAWVFVCWQWKRLITTLVQNWHNLVVLKKWITVNDNQPGKVIQESSGPSLRDIVEHYMDERWPVDKTSDVFYGDGVKINMEDPTKEVGVNSNSSIDVLEETGSSLSEKCKGITISSEEDTKSSLENYFKELVRKVLKEGRELKRRPSSLKLKGLQGKRSKKGKRKHKEQDLEDEVMLAITKVLQEENELEDLLKVIVRKVLKEEKEPESQPTRDVSISSEEAKKGESSEIQHGPG